MITPDAEAIQRLKRAKRISRRRYLSTLGLCRGLVFYHLNGNKKDSTYENLVAIPRGLFQKITNPFFGTDMPVEFRNIFSVKSFVESLEDKRERIGKQVEGLLAEKGVWDKSFLEYLNEWQRINTQIEKVKGCTESKELKYYYAAQHPDMEGI